MRIAHVVSTFPPHLGGMGSVCESEAKALAEQGYDVTIFTLKYPGKINSEADKRFPFKVVRLRPLIGFGDAGLVPQLLWKIGKNFDLVHLHYPFYGGAEWLSFLQIPLIITYHMDAQTASLKFLIQKLYDAVWPKRLFAKAKKIITVDAAFRNSKFLQNVSSGKITEIRNGVDTGIFKPQSADLDKLGLSDLKDKQSLKLRRASKEENEFSSLLTSSNYKKIILFVGNLLPLKRLDLLISAVKLLNNPEAVLVVVGGGDSLKKYKQMAKDLGVGSQVVFAGACDNKEKLVQYYNAAYCVAVPSDYESFSLVAAEAMACGKPLILSDLPVFKNNFNQAVFFQKGSVDSLKDALTRALSLSSEERKKMGEWGIAKANTDFSWDNHINKLKAVYGQV
ncbi:MAG: glycosyltransferase family 4 protein [Candidatus Magasanikbacteria bacterium]|nr:glycosyltransferase family 4 protein [Candidatus Magasanikbacteria bacterium]